MSNSFDIKNDPTLSYYNENAERFVEGTVNVDMREFYQEFLPLIPQNGSILDAGCGSGRDAKVFLNLGYEVVAFVNSPKIVKLASEFVGQDVLLMAFSDVSFEEKFDGIWACSSLLHVASFDLPDILSRLARTLKPSGVFYTSFKYGDDESVRGGRFFRDYTEQRFDDLLKKCPSLKKIKYWKTSDLRPGREDEKWLNILLKKL